MSDALLFYKLGWQGIWKQKIIFLYYAVFLFGGSFYSYFESLQKDSLWLKCLFSPILFISILVSLSAPIFLAHKITQSEPILLADMVGLIKKHFWRFTKLFFLFVFFFVLPLALGYLIQYRAKSLQLNQYIFLLAAFTSVFTGLWFFIFAEFLLKNKGLLKSISGAWGLFSKHFSVLLTMGIISFGIWYTLRLLISGVFEIGLSGFSIEALLQVNPLFPESPPADNLPYRLITYIVSVFSQAFTITSFIYAYNQYSPREEQTGKKIIRKLPK